MLVLMDLNKQVGTIANSKIAGDHIGHATVNPASNGRARDLQFWEEKAKPSSVSIPKLADCLLDPVVVSPPRVRSWHLGCTGRRVRESGPSRNCPVFSGRCSCSARGPECSETQRPRSRMFRDAATLRLEEGAVGSRARRSSTVSRQKGSADLPPTHSAQRKRTPSSVDSETRAPRERTRSIS
jgi:hypothetical protein